MTTAIIVAAGSSTRMQGKGSKPFLPLGPRSVLAWSLRAFNAAPAVDSIVVVTQEASFPLVREAAEKEKLSKPLTIVAGGATRLGSVKRGLAACTPGTDFVLVHDAARPCVTPELIASCLASARDSGSGVAAQPAVDTIKTASPDGLVEKTLDRSRIWSVQTPQAFSFSLLLPAISACAEEDPAITDEASALERAGQKVRLVRNPFPNPKITRPEDVQTVSRLLGI